MVRPILPTPEVTPWATSLSASDATTTDRPRRDVSNFPFGFNPGPDDAGEPARRRRRSTRSRRCSAPAARRRTSARRSSGSGSCCPTRAARSTGTSPATSPGRPSPPRATGRSAAAEREEVDDAVRLAELWLDAATALPAGATSASAWSRAEWVEATLPAWKALVDPVAGEGRRVDGRDARRRGRPDERSSAQRPSSCRRCSVPGPLQQMMRSIGGAMFGTQIGQALGALAREVVGSTDVGLPLAPAGKAALLPAERHGVRRRARRARGPGAALPRAARGRAPAAVRPRAVAARATSSTPSGLRARHQRRHRAARGGWWAASTRPTPRPCRRRSPAGCSSPRTPPSRRPRWPGSRPRSPSSRAGSTRSSTRPRRRSCRRPAALRETVRRRRATGGPAEQTFATLVGLELRPRRLREAAALWTPSLAARGIDGRDAVWAHPDLLPTADDLDDPAGFASGASAAPLDLSGLDDTEAPDDPARHGHDRRRE